jgi:hypothetical protein
MPFSAFFLGPLLGLSAVSLLGVVCYGMVWYGGRYGIDLLPSRCELHDRCLGVRGVHTENNCHTTYHTNGGTLA